MPLISRSPVRLNRLNLTIGCLDSGKTTPDKSLVLHGVQMPPGSLRGEVVNLTKLIAININDLIQKAYYMNVNLSFAKVSFN